MDSDGVEMGGPTQVDTDSEDGRPLVRASRVPRDVVEALEQDLCEAHPSSQSQSVMVAHADPSEPGRVMGVADMSRCRFRGVRSLVLQPCKLHRTRWCRCLQQRCTSCRRVLERRCHVRKRFRCKVHQPPDDSGWWTVQHISTLGQRKVFCGTWQPGL